MYNNNIALRGTVQYCNNEKKLDQNILNGLYIFFYVLKSVVRNQQLLVTHPHVFASGVKTVCPENDIHQD